MWILPSVMAMILFADFVYMLGVMGHQEPGVKIILPKQVGISLFTTYMIGVEIAAMLLLAGIVGAYHLGRQKKKVIHRFLQKEQIQEPEEETM